MMVFAPTTEIELKIAVSGTDTAMHHRQHFTTSDLYFAHQLWKVMKTKADIRKMLSSGASKRS